MVATQISIEQLQQEINRLRTQAEAERWRESELSHGE